MEEKLANRGCWNCSSYVDGDCQNLVTFLDANGKPEPTKPSNVCPEHEFASDATGNCGCEVDGSKVKNELGLSEVLHRYLDLMRDPDYMPSDLDAMEVAMALVSSTNEALYKMTSAKLQRDEFDALQRRLDSNICIHQIILNALAEKTPARRLLEMSKLAMTAAAPLVGSIIVPIIFARKKEAQPIYTYIVFNPASKLIKIGKTISVTQRLAALSTSGGSPLEILAVIEGDIEVALHKRFAAIRVHGEWFSDDGQIKAYAKDAKATAPAAKPDEDQRAARSGAGLTP
jgi:hypothetical protein